MLATPKGLSDEKAARMMGALRDGQTLRLFGVKATRLEAYFADHPDYAREARPLIEANAKASLLRKGARNGTRTHCINGHTLADARVYYQNGYIKRDCRTCWKIRSQRGGVMKPETLTKVKAALTRGATIGLIIHGRPLGGGEADPSLRIVDRGILARYRRENPEFDRFVVEATANNNCRGQKIRHARARTRLQTATRRDETNDYQEILALFPASFPGRDDAAHDLFIAMFEGALQREDMKGRVKEFIAAHYRMFPTKFAKFGNSPLVSLDEVMFEDGTTTRGDTVSRGLWD
jgi:hypothetical protein